MTKCRLSVLIGKCIFPSQPLLRFAWWDWDRGNTPSGDSGVTAWVRNQHPCSLNARRKCVFLSLSHSLTQGRVSCFISWMKAWSTKSQRPSPHCFCLSFHLNWFYPPAPDLSYHPSIFNFISSLLHAHIHLPLLKSLLDYRLVSSFPPPPPPPRRSSCSVSTSTPQSSADTRALTLLDLLSAIPGFRTITSDDTQRRLFQYITTCKNGEMKHQGTLITAKTMYYTHMFMTKKPARSTCRCDQAAFVCSWAADGMEALITMLVHCVHHLITTIHLPHLPPPPHTSTQAHRRAHTALN